MRVIDKDKISRLLDALANSAPVLVPARSGAGTKFTPWAPGVTLTLGEGNTTIPAKEIFFPQTQQLYSYCAKGDDLTIAEASLAGEKQVVFGLRPCDVKSVSLLDQVFLTGGYQDAYYKARRDNTVLVSLGCLEPRHTCFCDSLGINPARAEGADVVMHDMGSKYGLEAMSEKGQALLESVNQLLADINDGAPAGKPCTLRVETDGVTAQLQQMFNHPVWDSINKKCINCGTCTYVCPTCHCFDILSRNRGDAGYRFRCWDSCMFSEYTQMAGGHNPRPTKKERVRNRFLHKFQYFPERYGEWGCVGCGRCLVKCPVILDITRFVNAVREVAVHA